MARLDVRLLNSSRHPPASRGCRRRRRVLEDTREGEAECQPLGTYLCTCCPALNTADCLEAPSHPARPRGALVGGDPPPRGWGLANDMRHKILRSASPVPTKCRAVSSNQLCLVPWLASPAGVSTQQQLTLSGVMFVCL
jgi:hypothetical protein